MSTREIGKFVEMILGERYSAATVSNFTPATITTFALGDNDCYISVMWHYISMQ